MTGGAAGWQDPPEIRLGKVQADGLLVVRRPHLLAPLPAPWPEAQPHGEVMIELKLDGNHLDRRAVERALLRRQARQVQRLEEQDASWRGEEPLWLVAPYLPLWLEEMRTPVRCAPGCYWVEPQWHRFLWIAANELPLLDELIRFLQVGVARIVIDDHLINSPQPVMMAFSQAFIFRPEPPVRVSLREPAIRGDLVHLLVIAHLENDGEEIQAVSAGTLADLLLGGQQLFRERG